MANFLPHIDRVQQYDFRDKLTQDNSQNLYQVPVRIRWEDESDSDLFTLPYDPIISIEGGNNIVRRNVLKKSDKERRRGTIKEQWSQDDYKITITGVLIGDNGAIPETDLFRLRNYCEERKRIYIETDLTDTFAIQHCVVESWSLPHTAGAENQNYSIVLISDDEYDLLIKS
ncbi:MAG: DUF6046 domain-containing protein [Prevotellaceae bacterium]|jgi:hypothetical protein|nr:DUF6046 domain-containing protein [Prevotellaceae bacterium]